MKILTHIGSPSSQRVEWLAAEKALGIPLVHIDVTKGEQFTPEFRAKSPNCDVPVLELDDGTCITQVPAICQYLEDCFPEPPLFGTTPEQRAQTVMWDHLVTINGLLAIAEVVRNTSKATKDRPVVGPYTYVQLPELAERGRQRVRHFFEDLDQRLQNSTYLAGDFFSMADISAFVACSFARWIKEYPGAEQAALNEWLKLIAQREIVIV